MQTNNQPHESELSTILTETSMENGVLFSSKAWYIPQTNLSSPTSGTLQVTQDAIIFNKPDSTAAFHLKFIDTKQVQLQKNGYVKFLRDPDGKYDVCFVNPVKAIFIWTPKMYYKAQMMANECLTALQPHTKVGALIHNDMNTLIKYWVYGIVRNVIGAVLIIWFFISIFS